MRYLLSSLIVTLLAIGVPPTAAAQQTGPLVYFSYDIVTIGEAQTYALVPHTARRDQGVGWANLQKLSFSLLKRAKSTTYGLTTLYVNPDRTVTVNLDESKRPYHPIIVGELVYSLTELGARAVSFPSLRSKPYRRSDVDIPAFTLMTPLWRSLPPSKLSPGYVRMPDGQLIASHKIGVMIKRHDARIMQATLAYLVDKDERVVATALAALKPLAVPNIPGHILPLLDHSSPYIRLAVLGTLRASRDKAVLKKISGLIGQDKDARVTSAAAEILGASGMSQFATFALYHNLQDPNPKIAADAARQLGANKDRKALAKLAKVAGSKHGTLRVAAVNAVATIGGYQVLKDLLSFNEIPAETKQQAAKLLGEHPDPAMANNGHVFLLLNATGQASAHAATKLGQTRDPRVVPWLLQGLKHSDKGTRLSVASALGVIGDPRALGPLAEAAKQKGQEAFMSQQVIGLMTAQSLDSVTSLAGHQNLDIRRLATESLGHHVKADPKKASRRAIPLLAKAIGDFSPQVRAAAITGLGIAADPSTVHHLLKAVEDPDISVREAVARSLGSFRPPAGTAELVRLIKDMEDSVRMRALESAIARKDQKTVETIINYRRHGNPAIKRLVYQALGGINPPELHRSLREVFSEGVFDQDPEIRLASVTGLKAIKDPRVLDIMSVLLQDPNMAVRVATLKAYGATRYPQALQPLLAALQNHELEVKVAALEGMEALQMKEAIPHLKSMASAEPDEKLKKRLQAAIGVLKSLR